MSREHLVRAWLEEPVEDVELDDSDDSDADPDFVPENIPNQRSYESSDESDNSDDFDTDNNTSSNFEPDFYFGKDGNTKWYKSRTTNKTKSRAHNIVTQRPGVNTYCV